MVNRYLARSADLTLARLETVTAALNNPEATNGIQQVLEVLPGAVLEIIPRSSRPALFAFGLWAQARIEWAQSRPEAATYFLELVRKQPEIMGELSPGKERPPVNVSMLAARLALICDQIEEAIRWESTCGIRFKEFLYGRDYYERFPVTRNKKRSPYVLRATALDGTTLLCRGTECLGFNNL